MNLNATLIIQSVVFVILGWVTMKFIWPPLIRAIDDRRKKIADGLAAAERGHKELQSASGEAQVIVNEAREKALKIVDQATRRYHLTARQAGWLARDAGVRRLVPFHFSPKHSEEADRLVQEAMEAFGGS